MMKTLSVLVLAIIAAAASVGAETMAKTNLMRVDWDNWHTKEELEAGAFMRPSISSRIANGDIIRRPSEASYVGSVYVIRNNRWSFACTGSVVDERIFITAAHCTEWRRNDEMGVCVSAVKAGEGRCLKVVKFKVPQKYYNSDFDSRRPFTHDVALLKTEKKLVQRGSKAEIIRIDLSPRVVPNRGGPGYVFGYGDNNEASGQNDGKLRRLDITWKSMPLCDIDDDTVIQKHFLCVDSDLDGNGGALCYGDSGGPLVHSTDGSEDPDKHVLLGVLSYGYVLDGNPDPCPAPALDGYSRLTALPLSNFLRRAMRALGGEFTVYEG